MKPRLIATDALPRPTLYKLLGMAKNSLSLSDADYRQLLEKNGGKPDATGRVSAKSLNHDGLAKTLHDLQLKGAVLGKPQANAWRKPRLAKANAIWHALADAGVVHDRSTQALDAFVAGRVPGVTHLRWATSEQLNTVIEMLKRFAARANVRLH